jgi:hypothetical protein
VWSLEREDALLEPLYISLIPFGPDYARMLNQLLLSVSRGDTEHHWVDKIDSHKLVRTVFSRIVVNDDIHSSKD